MQRHREAAHSEREREAPLPPLGRFLARPFGRRAGAEPGGRRKKAGWSGLLFALPAIVVLGFVFAIPIAQVIGYSLTDWRGGVRPSEFVGLENYERALTSDRVLDSLKHNALLLTVIPIEVALGVFVASLLRERIYGWRTYRFLVFVPLMLSITIVGYTWTYFLSPTGIINTILEAVGLDEVARPWLADSTFALWAVALVLIWRDTGFAVILFYSRLLAVDNSIYESAALDGARRLKRILRIDLPLLKGPITVFWILMTIWLFNFVFNYVFVTTAGGPGYASNVIETEIYREGFRLSQFGYASAIAALLLIVSLPILITQIWLQLRRRSIA